MLCITLLCYITVLDIIQCNQLTKINGTNLSIIAIAPLYHGTVCRPSFPKHYSSLQTQTLQHSLLTKTLFPGNESLHIMDISM